VPLGKCQKIVISKQRSLLVDRTVVAGFAAGRTVVKTILAEADIDLALAEAAVLLAAALLFRRFALHADVLLAGSGA
jgi:hypothetical protein